MQCRIINQKGLTVTVIILLRTLIYNTMGIKDWRKREVGRESKGEEIGEGREEGKQEPL